MKPPPASALVSRVMLLTLFLLVFAGSLGLGAVWMRQGISSAANESRALQVQIEDVERRLDEVNARVAAAVNPNALIQQNTAMRLALAAPREIQVVRVSESAELKLAAKRNREVFTVAPASFELTAQPARAPRVVAPAAPDFAKPAPAFNLTIASLR